MKQLAEKLIKLERQLNNIFEKANLPAGSLLADYWRLIYKEQTGNKVKTKGLFLEILSIIKFVSYFLFTNIKSKKETKYNILVIGKSHEKFHYCQLLDYITNKINNSEVIKNDYKLIYVNLTLRQRLRVIEFSILSYFQIKGKLKNITLTNNFKMLAVSLTILISLIRYYATIEYIRNKQTKLIIVDFDRDIYAPLVLAGNSLKIKTVSLQHGAINPPYGYVPVLASEIWVWGRLWKDALVKMGEPTEKIKITGSTIVGSFNVLQIRNRVQHIGIGPNPVGNELNKEIWEPLVTSLLNNGYDIIVKLHPSMEKLKHGEKIFGEGCKILNTGELSNHDFFQNIDLLIVSTSGLGYEAIIAGIPVAVVRENESSEGNDYIMIEKGKFPEIRNDNNINETILNISCSFNQIIKQEQEFLRENIYEFTGECAENKTIELIQDIINDLH